MVDCVEPFLSERQELLSLKLEELLEHYRGDYASQIDSEFLRQLSERVAIRERSREAQPSMVRLVDTEGVVDSMLTFYEVSPSQDSTPSKEPEKLKKR